MYGEQTMYPYTVCAIQWGVGNKQCTPILFVPYRYIGAIQWRYVCMGNKQCTLYIYMYVCIGKKTVYPCRPVHCLFPIVQMYKGVYFYLHPFYGTDQTLFTKHHVHVPLRHSSSINIYPGGNTVTQIHVQIQL